LPRVLAGLLVPIAGILLLTFYFSNRPGDTEAVTRVPAGNGVSAAAADPGPAAPVGGESPEAGVAPADTPVVSATVAPEPTPEPIATPPATVTVTPTTSGEGGRVNTEDGLNIRSGPSTNFGVVRVAPFGEFLELTGESTPEGDQVWVELVEDGWVQDQYLDFE
jgi:hypothetical protein